jgi:uncharacterized membrane protein required for colicin V production
MDDPAAVLSRIVMKLLYRPVGIILGLAAGFLSKSVFNFVWSKIDDEEAPKATIEETSWAKVLSAAAVQGIVFQTVRAAVNRGGAQGFRWLTGVWPGEKRPDPK